MTRISFAVTLLLSVYISQGQVFKIQAGTSLSSLDWNIITNNYKIPGNRIVGQSIFFGFDYAEKRYFNLSSNIGTIRKGSRQKEGAGKKTEAGSGRIERGRSADRAEGGPNQTGR